MINRLPIRYAIAFCCALLCAFMPTQVSAQQADPWQHATLYRDEWGVPHIYAENLESLGFVFGYAQADDHLSDMLIAYRIALGRAAEVLGEAYAESDAFSIKMGHADLAAEAWQYIDPTTAALCTGFAQGVNLWIVENPDRTPSWAEGVQPKDILALWHAYLMSMAPMDLPELWRRAPAAHTGNAWAVSSSRSESGATLLVVNPHQKHNGYFRWHEAHLIMPGYNMYGATLFGLPAILQGHNGMLGWALTPNMPDTADIYQEPITDQAANAPNTFNNPIAAIPQRAGVMLEYASRTRPYYVRTQGGLEERQIPQWIVERGPVMEAQADFFHTWRIGGYRNFGGLAQLFEMGAAQSLQDFQSALFAQQLPCFHIVYADRAGNLFYLYNAIAGVRDAFTAIPQNAQGVVEPFNWKAPLPPFNDHIFWGEVFPPDSLPYILNPQSGYIQACGNPPWTATDNSGLDAADWPWWLAEDTDTYRALRVRELLRSGMRNFQDMQNMLYDDALPAAKDMCALLLTAADANPEFVKNAHPDLQSTLDGLRNWRQNADTENTSMTFYHLWWAMMQAQNPLGIDSNTPLYQLILQNTPETQRSLLNAAAESVRLLRNQYPNTSIPWGEVHRLVRGSQDAPMSGAGAGEPIFISSDYAYKDGRWQVTYGYGFAMAVEFGELPRAVSIVPFGASESPTSAHYADQFALFTEKKFKPTYFLMEDVARNAPQAIGRSITLYPKGVNAALYAQASSKVSAHTTTFTEAPVPIPEGAAAFSLFVKPELSPKPESVQFYYDVHVSEALCPPEYLSQLALWAYTEGAGWVQVPEQTQDPATMIISCRLDVSAILTVLGPKEVFQSSVPVTNNENEGETTNLPSTEGEHYLNLPEAPEPERTFKFLRHDLPPGVDTADTLDGKSSVSTFAPKGERTFKFERHDLPEGVKTEDTIDGKTGASIDGPTGERRFKFERHDAPDAPKSPEEKVAPIAPDASVLPGEATPAPAMPLEDPVLEGITPDAEMESDPTPEAEPAPETEGPTGKRKFKFERHD